MYFEIFQGVMGWYWRLRAGNGKTIADGSEVYFSKSNVKRAVRRFENLMRRESWGNAEIREI
jgi:uncharacterized protein YegP (UPF0339 family)